ncbi:hypothetical protein Gohar_008352 [Gossypium harknessii]|uniref:RNase H type-1 domain-containing protein n=1 Tax=Gossypium harknessii TaxID=34285 RepID=A0A7J9GJD9_9ROSI|nr:hypothetical protein [Gossypium harknessii]
MNPRPPRSHRGTKPPNEAIKINVDAAVFDSVAEALKEGIMWTSNNNVTRAVFETDCASLVNRLKSRKEDLSIFGFQLKEIFKLFESFIDVKIE